MVMLNETAADVPSLLVAVTLKLAVSAAAGVPDMTPSLPSDNPVGNAPDDIAQLVGLLVAARVAL